MALIKCSECGKEISDKAEACVHCGCPIEQGNICEECGNSFSKDKKVCPNCGYQTVLNIENTDKKVFKNYEEYKSFKKTHTQKVSIIGKIWLIWCMIAYTFAAFLTLGTPESSMLIVLGNITLNLEFIGGIFVVIAYYLLYKNLHKENMNLIIGIYIAVTIIGILGEMTSGISLERLISMAILTVILIIIELLFAYLAVRHSLNNEKINIKSYIKIYGIVLLFTACISIIFNELSF